MKFIKSNHFTDPDTAARKLIEIANGIEALTERAMPFVEFWQHTFDAMAEDGVVTIEPSDIPLWLDDGYPQTR